MISPGASFREIPLRTLYQVRSLISKRGAVWLGEETTEIAETSPMRVFGVVREWTEWTEVDGADGVELSYFLGYALATSRPIIIGTISSVVRLDIWNVSVCLPLRQTAQISARAEISGIRCEI